MEDGNKYSKSSSEFDVRHDKRTAQIERSIQAIYMKATEEAAAIGARVKGLGKKPFSFADYPEAKKKADKLIDELGHSMETAIVDGVKAEWELAEQKNDALSSLVFGDNADKLTPEQIRQYFIHNNGQALQAFLQRKTAGLNLSDRVWRYTDGFKNEIEMSLDLGIREGKSAAAMSRDLRDYLQHPDKLFRRVRDEHGMLHLSKAAKGYHPGMGVYRSSYMNARRLAVTEVNMAYRASDYARYQQLDFIVGIRIVLSNNHNCKGIPKGRFSDICDDLQGEYPKDFKFTGWHPQCRCHTETILKTKEELREDTRRMSEGKEPLKESKNTVHDVPDNFKEWLTQNKDRYIRSMERDTLPYFATDNSAVCNRILGIVDKSKPTALETAAKRHAERTAEQARTIQQAWNERRIANVRRAVADGYLPKECADGLSELPQKQLNDRIAFLQKRAAAHAARTSEQVKKIQDAWDKRKAQYAAIETEAKEMQKLFYGAYSIDLKKAITKYDLKTAKTEIDKLQQLKDELSGLKWLDDPVNALNKGIKKDVILETNGEIQSRVADWLKTQGYKSYADAPADKLLEFLDNELGTLNYKSKTFAKKNIEKLKKDLMKANPILATKKTVTKALTTTKTLKTPNKGVVVQSNTKKSGFFIENNEYFEAEPGKATDYVFKYTNVVENSFNAYAQTAEGNWLDAADLKKLCSSSSKDELYKNVRDIRKKYPKRSAECLKLKSFADNIYRECMEQAQAVDNFSFGWDYEIRQIQCGNTKFKSRYGHSMTDIKARADALERFIENSPKWNGGVTYRGMSLSEKELDNLIDEFKRGEGNMLGSASWSAEESISMGFSDRHLGEYSHVYGDEKTQRVIIRTKEHKHATPIMHLSEIDYEAEVLSSHHERWKFVKMKKIVKQGYEYIYIDVEPV